MKKPWSGRFKQSTDKLMEEFSASISFDRRLYAYDIAGSIAHCKMLAKCKIISQTDSKKIIGGLKRILKEFESGKFQCNDRLEDIHMNIESRLTELVGSVGGKLHTARSRNDQVCLDLRLYLAITLKSGLQAFGQIRFLPREATVGLRVATKVAVSGCALINRTAQVQVLTNTAW